MQFAGTVPLLRKIYPGRFEQESGVDLFNKILRTQYEPMPKPFHGVWPMLLEFFTIQEADARILTYDAGIAPGKSFPKAQYSP